MNRSRLRCLLSQTLFLICHLVYHYILHILAHFLFLGRVGVAIHCPDGSLEQVICGLDTSPLELGHAEVDENEPDVGEYGIQEKSPPTEMGHHRRCGLCDTIVHNPVDEEAATHGETTDPCGEYLCCHHIGRNAPTEAPSERIDVDPFRRCQ
jgi:hypothetical protein